MAELTIQHLIEWGACHEYIEHDVFIGPGEPTELTLSLFRGRKSIPALTVARMYKVPAEDRVWCLLRPEVLGDRLDDVLDDIIEPPVERYCLNCGIPEVEHWAERWLSGEDRTPEAARLVAEKFAPPYGAPERAVLAVESVENDHWRAGHQMREAVWQASGAGKELQAARSEDRRQLRIIKRALKALEDDQ